MKKKLFFLLLVPAIQNMNSQVVFCPPGAQWTNFFINFAYPYNAVEKAMYVGDSLIGAQNFKIISHREFFTDGCDFGYTQPGKPNTLIKQSGDTIFMRNTYTQHNWQVLYNFAATPGDVWVDSLGSAPTMRYYKTFVNSVGYVTINNFLLKQLSVTVRFCGADIDSNYLETNGTITERIGFDGYLFPYNYRIYNNNFCEQNSFKERLCYSDNAFGIGQFSQRGCYFTGISENAPNPSGITFFPNPTQATLHFKSDIGTNEKGTIVSLTNLDGKEIKQVNIRSEENTIDLKGISNGLYIVQVTRNNELLYTTKLVKQE